MKDAKIVVLSTEKNKKKYLNFLQYCLVNKNKDVDCEILLGPKNSNSFAEELLESNPIPNIKTKITRFDTDEPAVKRNSNYHALDENTSKQYKWLITIDDDSVTDVDSLVDNLEDEFGQDHCAFVTGEIQNSWQVEEQSIIEAFGKSKWYRASPPNHEWEIACINQKTMNVLLQSDIAKKIFDLRSKMYSGWGDHCLGIALRFCKIHPISSNFLTAVNRIYEHTLVGKHFSHVHQIYNDLYEYKNLGINHVLPILTAPNNTKTLSAWYSVFEHGCEKMIGLVNFNLDKTITPLKEGHKVVGFWRMDEDKIMIHRLEESEPLELVKGKQTVGSHSKWELFN